MTEREEKLEAMRLLVDHIIPGRAEDSRWSSEKELKATTIVAMSIDEASAKVRTGGPVDDEADYELGHWAGQVPLTTVAGPAIPDPRCDEPVPAYVGELARDGRERARLIAHSFVYRDIPIVIVIQEIGIAVEASTSTLAKQKAFLSSFKAV